LGIWPEIAGIEKEEKRRRKGGRNASK